MVQLVHIGVIGGLPGSDPTLGSAGLIGSEQVRSVGHIVDSQGEADGLESGGSVGQGLEGGVITVAGSTDVDLILHLGTGGSGSDLAVRDGVTGSLEVAQGSLQSGGVLVLALHVGGVDFVAVHIGGVGDLVAVVGDGRSSPGGVGDRVVDDGGGVAVVGVDALIAVSGDDGHDGLAQVLGGLGGGVAADIDVLGAQGDVAVAAVVLQAGGDDGAVLTLDAVDVGNLVSNLQRVGRIGDVDGAGLNAGDLIGLLGLLHVDVGDLGCAVIVGGVGIQIDNAVAVLGEGEHTGTHGSAGLGADAAQVTLGKAEGVVVVVVQALIAVVVQRGDGHLQLVDHGGGQLGGGQRHAVVTGLDDTGHRSNGVTDVDTGGGVGVDVLGDQVRQGGTGSLGLHGREVPVVVRADQLEHILRGCACGQLAKVPGGGGTGSIVSVGGSAVLNALVDDLLGKLHTAVVDSVPESLLLLGSEFRVVGVVLAGLSDQLGQRGHGAAVLVQTNDGGRVHGYRTIIRRIEENIHREDDVVDGDRLTVGELQVLAQLDVIGNGAVGVLGDNAVGRTVVGVVSAVVLAGLALDAVQDHLTLTVSAQQGDLGQVDDILVSGRSSKEGAELALKAGLGQNERTVGSGSGGCLGSGRAVALTGRSRSGRSSTAAACQHADAESGSRCQCNGLLGVFHVVKPPINLPSPTNQYCAPQERNTRKGEPPLRTLYLFTVYTCR